MKISVLVMLFVLIMTAFAEAHHNTPVLNIYHQEGTTNNPSGDDVKATGIFIGFLGGIIGLEYTRLDYSSGGSNTFRGVSSQMVVPPIGESGAPWVVPVRPVLSLGFVEKSFGGRLGVDGVYQLGNSRSSLFLGIHYWMTADGTRIPMVNIGLGF